MDSAPFQGSLFIHLLYRRVPGLSKEIPLFSSYRKIRKYF